jgi:hypothetical protein
MALSGISNGESTDAAHLILLPLRSRNPPLLLSCSQTEVDAATRCLELLSSDHASLRISSALQPSSGFLESVQSIS